MAGTAATVGTVSPAGHRSAAARPVLIAGRWCESGGSDTFSATNPQTRTVLDEVYPISGGADIESALAAASDAAKALRAMADAGQRISGFLAGYAGAIESRSSEIVAAAMAETGLPLGRLRDVELPRTTAQLRQAATAAREGSWLNPIIDRKLNLRSCLGPIGPVLVIGPSNFPLAFNGVSGGDFAAAIAAGNPVLAKGHPLHPTTTRLLAEAAHTAATEAGLPAGTVQLIYHLTAADGLAAVGDRRLKAVAFTGSRAGGLAIKRAADAAGTLFFGEMSSLNPLFVLPGALAERPDAIAKELAGSILAGAGQFCTKPGLIVLVGDSTSEAFIARLGSELATAEPGCLLSQGGERTALAGIGTLLAAGARRVGEDVKRTIGGYGIAAALLRITGEQYLQDPEAFQTEVFASAALLVVAHDASQLPAIAASLEGNLTGSIYSAADGRDDATYDAVAAVLRAKVGRLLNDKVPTGVAVSPAMNHGGPYPATSQPHFSAVGLPGSIARFTQRECYDNVRPHRLPPCLQDRNPTGRLWRVIDGQWTLADV